ncbi:porin family protein [Bacteroidota bacterium]
MSRTYIFFSIILLIFYSGQLRPVQAQDQSCTNQLEDIQEFFGNGNYHMIPGYTDDCLASGFTKSERITAYRLITITYLFLDDLNKADSVYTLLLREDPERLPDPSVDPPDLVFLHNNFRTSPIFATKIFGGINYTIPEIIHNVSLYSDDLVDERYVASLGGVLGAGIELNVMPGLSLGTEAAVSIKNIDYRNTFLERQDTIAEIYQTVGFTENQFWLDIPIYLKYTIEKGRIRPYIFGGFSWNFLFFTQASGIVKSYNQKIAPSGDFGLFTFEDPGFDIAERRSLVNYGLIFGAGVMFKLEGINYLTIDLRYNPGMTNVFNTKKRFENDAQIIQYGRLGDDFRISAFSLNLGFFLPHYKPKKISDNTDI